MPEREIRAVAFDLDGLMFNTEAAYNRCGTEILRRRGKQATPELFTRMMGRRAPEAFAVMIEMMELTDSVDVLQQETDEILRRLIEEMVEPMPGLDVVRRHIGTAELPRAVATSSGRRYLETLLSKFEILDWFTTTLTAEDVTQGKPHPEIYVAAAQRLGVAPEQMLVLEDSEAGVTAAAAAGAVAVAVPHEHSSHHDFSRAQLVAERLDDPRVLALLG